MSQLLQLELDAIQFWNDDKIYEKIQEETKNNQEWYFVDGPPFVNGSPHHGHLLVSTIKDTMARFMMSQGYKIPYQIGFDCHGLPLEQEAEKTVGKVMPNDTNENIALFNDKCRDIISNCSDIWYNVLGRLGRQFNKNETYMTSSFDYMKTTWWAFGQLWSKGLIYCSKKVMPYSPKCQTPLSNFEANQNYKNITDTSVYVFIKLENIDEYIMIWTTTPWSLFANQGVCVNPTFNYVLIDIDGKKTWIAETCLERISPAGEIINNKLGADFVGAKYEPIFDNAFVYDETHKIFADDYVRSETGTGIVHLAPIFGEDDLRVMKNNSYDDTMMPNIVNDAIEYTIDYIVNDNNINGKFVMDASLDIAIHLKKLGKVFKTEKIKHSYPHCYRTDCPLIYYALEAWFINVSEIIPELIEINKQINWYPSSVGTARFAEWISHSPDWCISRTRIWGTPIPVWTNGEDFICISSVDEIEKITGRHFDDIHLDKIGDITFEKNNTIYKRTFGVLDCWFESGIASVAHKGFSSVNDEFKPIDFICESLDQTRGWFYTLNILSTALFHKPAFNNVVVSGLILARDGQKMSKHLGNFTSPMELINKYGSDVFRLYLLSSPATKAEAFKFDNNELNNVSRSLLPFYYSLSMLSECYTYYKQEYNDIELNNHSNNILDKWINAILGQFNNDIINASKNYNFQVIHKYIVKFIDNFCNIYIRLSRPRFKLQHEQIDAIEGLGTLYCIIDKFCRICMPYMPHICEGINIRLSNIVGKKPETILSTINDLVEYNVTIINAFDSVNELIEGALRLRVENKLPVYQPLNDMIVYTANNEMIIFSELICHELNIKNIVIKDINQLKYRLVPNEKVIFQKFKKEAKNIIASINEGNDEYDMYCIKTYSIDKYDGYVGTEFINNEKHIIIYLSTMIDNDLEVEGTLNFIRRRVNEIRKQLGLKIFNKISIEFENNDFWRSMNDNQIAYIKSCLVADVNIIEHIHDEVNENNIQNIKIKELNIKVKIIN